MLGLPTETAEDVEGIADLSDKIARVYYEIPKTKGKVGLILHLALIFCTKPFTPFQWVAMETKENYLEKQRLLRAKFNQQLNKKSIKFNWHDAETSVIEGVFARGDRRVAKAIYSAYKSGCIYDSWSEHFDYDKWIRAFKDNDIDVEFYANRQRDYDEYYHRTSLILVRKDFMERI